MKSAHGIVPPLVTPLTDQNLIDVAGLECLIEHVLSGGVHGLFVLGTTGEGPSLSYDQRREVIRHTSQIVDGRKPIYVGITDTALAESVALAQFAAEAGCDFVVAAPPYYYPLEQQELVAYFAELLREMPLPTLIYNMPAVTGITIELQTVRSLLHYDQCIGLKDSSGNLEYFKSILEIIKSRSDFSVLVGPEHLLASALELGGDGGVTGGANIWPKPFVTLYEFAVTGKVHEVSPLIKDIARLGEIYKTGPQSVAATIARTKAALSICKICGESTLPPLFEVSPNERKRIAAVLAQLGIVPDLVHDLEPSPQPA